MTSSQTKTNSHTSYSERSWERSRASSLGQTLLDIFSFLWASKEWYTSLSLMARCLHAVSTSYHHQLSLTQGRYVDTHGSSLHRSLCSSACMVLHIAGD